MNEAFEKWWERQVSSSSARIKMPNPETMKHLRSISEAAWYSATPQWQPIETAPKDGALIWLGNKHSMRTGFWIKERWVDYVAQENNSIRTDLFFKPTHWQPLPKPPE